MDSFDSKAAVTYGPMSYSILQLHMQTLGESLWLEAYVDLCAKWDATWVIPGQILLMADPAT